MPSDTASLTTRSLELVKIIASTPAETYLRFTDPVHVSRWFTTRAQADLRPGGRYSNADGDQGEYLELEPPHRVKFTWDNPAHCPGTQVEVTFSPTAGDKVKVVLIHALLKSSDDLEDMRKGWSWALESLKSYLETGKPIQYEEWLKRSG
jgi:uncharacterized protein YndB with AHSA1/START domain